MTRPIQKNDVYAVAATVREGIEIFPATQVMVIDAMPCGMDRFQIAECGGTRHANMRHMDINGPEIRFLIECGQWTLIEPTT